MIAGSLAGGVGLLVNKPIQASNEIVDLKEFMKSPQRIMGFYKRVFNIDIAHITALSIRNLWRDRNRPLIVGTSYNNDGLLLALYSLLISEVVPDHKLVICSSNFRRTKAIFDDMVQMYDNSNVVDKSGIFKSTDMCGYKKDSTSVLFMPLGSGERIRGMRADQVLGDGFSNLSMDEFNTVVAGFAAVRSNPISRIKNRIKRNA